MVRGRIMDRALSTIFEGLLGWQSYKKYRVFSYKSNFDGIGFERTKAKRRPNVVR